MEAASSSLDAKFQEEWLFHIKGQWGTKESVAGEIKNSYEHKEEKEP